MFGRKKIAMLVAEFLGTAVLTMVILAVQRSTIGIPYFVSIAGGLAIGGLTLVLANASGAELNPAVTIGAFFGRLFTGRKLNLARDVAYLVAQFLGGWAAYGLYTYFVNSSFQPIGGHFTLRLMIAEAVGAFVFVFVWAAVAAQRLSNAASGVAYTIGLLVASIASVGIINPAVAVGTRAFAFWGSMGWGTYLAGPIVGGIVGFGLYELLFGRETVAVAAAASAPAVVVSKPVAVSRSTAAVAAPRKTTRATTTKVKKPTTTRRRK